MRKISFCSVLLCSLASFGNTDEVPFTELSFEETTQKAFSLEKLVFVNFYSDSCQRCEEMHRTTFKDPKVLAWFDEHAIPVSVNVTRRTALAQRYFPVLPGEIWEPPELAFVIISSTGDYLTLWIGYANPARLISLGNAVLNSPTNVEKVREVMVDSGSYDPMSRMALADAYVIWGRYEDALREYLWCFDVGPTVDLIFIGTRAAYLIGKIHDLAKVYPDAYEALLDRRDALFYAILVGGKDYEISTFTQLNKKLGDRELIIRLYQELKQDKRKRTRALNSLVEKNIDLFVVRELYDQIVSNVDLVTKAKHEIVFMQIDLEKYQSRPESLHALIKDQLRKKLAMYYLVFLATSQEEKAQEMAGLLLEAVGDAASYHELADTGLRSLAPTELNVEQAQKAVEMDPRNSSYVNTYVRLLHAMGRQEQAAAIRDEYSTLIEDLTLDMPVEERDVLLNSVERDVSGNQSQ